MPYYAVTVRIGKIKRSQARHHCVHPSFLYVWPSFFILFGKRRGETDGRVCVSRCYVRDFIFHLWRYAYSTCAVHISIVEHLDPVMLCLFCRWHRGRKSSLLPLSLSYVDSFRTQNVLAMCERSVLFTPFWSLLFGDGVRPSRVAFWLDASSSSFLFLFPPAHTRLPSPPPSSLESLLSGTWIRQSFNCWTGLDSP